MFKDKQSIIATVVTVLLMISLGSGLYFFSAKRGADEKLSEEKIKSEKMLSEKLALAKEIDKLKKEIALQSDKNGALDKNVKNLQSQLAKKESDLKALNQAIAERDKYKKQLADLTRNKELSDKELAELRNQLKNMEVAQNDMRFDAEILKEKNEALAERNQMLSSLMANNYGLEAHKKKDKLTVKAKRAKEIVAGFDLPVNMTENLRFTITTPQGKKVNSMTSKNIRYMTMENIETNTELVASTDWKVGALDFTKRVTLTYKPEEKLNGGIYQIDIYAEDIYLGSSQIRLK